MGRPIETLEKMILQSIRAWEGRIAMGEAEFRKLAQRLEELERINQRNERAYRKWKRIGVALLGCTLIVAFTGAADQKPAIVEAKEFVLRDESKFIRASLAIRSDGTPGFALYDKNGKARLEIDLSPEEEGSLNLSDASGTFAQPWRYDRTARPESACSGRRVKSGPRSTSGEMERQASMSMTTPVNSAPPWHSGLTRHPPSAFSMKTGASSIRSNRPTSRRPSRARPRPGRSDSLADVVVGISR